MKKDPRIMYSNKFGKFIKKQIIRRDGGIERGYYISEVTLEVEKFFKKIAAKQKFGLTAVQAFRASLD